MADLSVEWDGDLGFAADGDLLLSDGSDSTRQSIIRRLLTSLRGYVWAPEYGTSIPERVGRPAQAAVLQAIVRGQIRLEATVSQVPPARVTVTPSQTNPGLFVIDIRYTDAITGEAIAISFEAPGDR